MKKKILFINDNLISGGVEKSLITLLGAIDYNKYDVDLFLFRHEGLFMNAIPSNVNLLKAEIEFEHTKKAVKFYIKRFDFIGAIKKVMVTLRMEKKQTVGEKWEVLNKIVPKCNKKYDVAIAYNDYLPLYYLVEYVEADKKIAWNHTDYIEAQLDSNFDRKYYKKIDNLVTISRSCAEKLVITFPEYKNKIYVIENITNKKLFIELAEKKNPYASVPDGDIKIISVGRLVHDKGYDISLEAIKRLIQEKYKIKWFIIGVGSEENQIVEFINNNNLNDNIILLHEQANPYPYILNADIYIQTSRVEGKSIAIEEAKLLMKPIVVTHFPTVVNQIEDGKSGLIADMNAESVYLKLKELIDNPQKREELSKYLKENCDDNRKQVIEQFDMLMG